MDYDATVAKVQAVVDGYPGLKRDLLTYLRERIKEVLTGASATVVVRIFGPEIERLQANAAAVKKALEGVGGNDRHSGAVAGPGAADRSAVPAGPGGAVRASRRETSAARSRRSCRARRSASSTISSACSASSCAARRSCDAVRKPFARCGSRCPGGTDVPLGAVAQVTVAPALSEVTREGGSRKIDVTCNVRGRDLGSVARDIEARLRQLSLGDGYHAEVLGEYALRQESSRRLLAMSGLTFLAIFLLLLVDFGDARLALLVFVTLPFALVGAIAAAFLSTGVLSLGSLVGLVTVIGIAARNGIMMVSHFRHLELEEGVPFGRDLVMRGAEERLAPILMTALATGLALLPIAFGGDKAGQEIEHPLAVVILGGLVTSTILNLFLLPPLYLRFRRKTAIPRQ